MLDELIQQRQKKICKRAADKKSHKWTAKEMARMFELMVVFGTDFSIVAVHLQSKTRDQIKRKFNQLQSTRAKEVRTALSGSHTAEMWEQLNQDFLELAG